MSAALAVKATWMLENHGEKHEIDKALQANALAFSIAAEKSSNACALPP